MLKNLSHAWKKPMKNMPQEMKRYMIEWRKQGTLIRVEHPTRIDRAKRLGYKAKQGFFVVRVRVPRGMRKRPRPDGGRRPKRAGSYFSVNKSMQVIAEQKAEKKYVNSEVLNSYWVGEDGLHKWFEVILIDRSHPAIINDKDVGWIANERGRANRGLTSKGKKSRGLRNKGRGAESIRPSKGAVFRRKQKRSK